MKLDIGVGTLVAKETPLLVLPWCQDSDREVERPTANFDPLDESLGLTLTRAVTSGDFKARRGEMLLLYRQGETGPDRVLVVGVGDRGDLSEERMREVGGRAANRAADLGVSELTVSVSPGWLGRAMGTEEAARALVEGVVLGYWRFDELKHDPVEESDRQPLHALSVLVPTAKSREAAERGTAHGRAVAMAQNYARELAARPANIVNPRYLADEARKLAEDYKDLTVKILDREAIKKDGMAALLAVAEGSNEEPRFIVLEYSPKKGSRPLALVGKGVTFDSGGLSLKTPQGMESMKYDMSGAAAVLGAVRAIAELGIQANVIGLIPAVENMPSGHALRPGDVISSRSRKTIEVLNTDAEGRLILADALSYAARYEPEAVVDIATLTGACVIALGDQAIGLLGNDQDLIDEIRDAGRRSGERTWQLPLWDEYRDQLKSEVADIKNTGGRPAGTITAAMFLREFVGSKSWAHLDIAGTAWAEKAGPVQPVGPTGVGVRLFTEWVRGRAS
jgi:leucyl aminopeptidase